MRDLELLPQHKLIFKKLLLFCERFLPESFNLKKKKRCNDWDWVNLLDSLRYIKPFVGLSFLICLMRKLWEHLCKAIFQL